MVFFKEIFGEYLASLQNGSVLGRPEDTQPFLLKGIHHPCGEGQLRANDGEVDLFL